MFAGNSVMSEMNTNRVRGVTMVELLTTIALLSMLLAILLPAVQSARETARRLRCSGNMRQIGLASLHYHDAKKALPPGFTQERIDNVLQGHSAFYFLLPFLEEKTVFDTMDARVPRNNITAVIGTRAAAALPILVCPSDVFASGNPYKATDGNFYGVTSYRANGGSRPVAATASTNDGTFMATGSQARRAATAPPGQVVRFSHITDGSSKTLLFAEMSHADEGFDTFSSIGLNDGQPIAHWSRWYPGGDDSGLGHMMCGAFVPIKYVTPFRYGELGAPATPSDWAIHQDRRLGAIGSQHRKGAIAVFADGSVRLLEESMEQSVLSLICRRADGEQVKNLP